MCLIKPCQLASDMADRSFRQETLERIVHIHDGSLGKHCTVSNKNTSVILAHKVCSDSESNVRYAFHIITVLDSNLVK